ncbi:xanthine/uracil permease family protein [[Clostridium] sordellii]|uniref:Xanthine/uracil permease family protein n=1 Tax=Paraclostridium sordellii TaxID=1505 RepID=A0ABP1XUX8_PARSO|nr:NCS2 family permease [Paeniclostridium sordellii]CEJ75151.1 xanthine/uracil permease family protein [[Clostridium] sordellii] [Paeniclostridium sordellii]CEN70920.1 xanthine/uracil permease family protein [[Clostridium] sordellii] [Paeniclostridium sordellii]CEN74211.1 xanthine/uracil permease family protein [[Clostridium] sordellii] [Paeniclostridium sordellii]CEO30302.1 xanthine/uracil permease family protein [[Clostridium] sordellii] [Paeniclostridium sordellii]CEP65791.1 xanthine/uracil
MQNTLEKFFKLSKNNTNVKTEVLAGVTTFMTIAYILVVNPSILGQAGMDKGAVFTATAIASGIGCFVMGLLANYPIILAPSMGINAFFTYTVVLGMGYTWQFALCAMFIEGVIFVLLTITNVREKIIECMPEVLKHAITAGIGLFITFIGLVNAGIVQQGGAIISLGNIKSPVVLLAIIGLMIAATLLIKNVNGAFLISIIITSAIGMIFTIVPMPTGIIDLPPSIQPVFMKVFDVSRSQIFSLDMLVIVLTLLFVNMFDSIGFLLGIAQRANLLDENGNMPNVKKALLAESISTTSASVLGTSTLATTVESGSGIAVGGRTGLTACVTGILFFISLFFAPLFVSIPAQATAPILILVGFLMASSILKINFEDFTDAIPAFITFIMMPLSYSVADGIMFGIIAYTFLKLIAGKKEETKISLLVLSIIFILKFAFL